MPRANVNGISLYYEVAGTGAPLVFVHGFACGMRSWEPQVKALSRRFRVITYDVRGFGISDAPDDPARYSQPTSVADLAGLLDHLRIKRAIVGGLSMGGNIALNFALAHPDRVKALIVADTGSGSDEHADWVAAAQGLADAALEGGMEAFTDLACANPLFARYIAQGPHAERFIRSCLMTHRARGVAHTAREVLCRRPTLYALEEKLRALKIPTLLIVGEHDGPCVRVHAWMAKTLPRATAITIPGVGHLTNLEAPDTFNRAVVRFLSK
jgi:pimeloyl-ACP methyl ester carboxylesterase